MSLRWRSLSGAPSNSIETDGTTLPWAATEVRGLCGGRCADAEGREVEVAVWIDGPSTLGWHTLWGWESRQHRSQNTQKQNQWIPTVA